MVFLTLPLLPGAYFYVIYLRQIGGMELRANRLISIYLYVILVATVSGLLFGLLAPVLVFPGSFVIISVVGAVLAAVFTLLAYPLYRRFFELYLLRMPLPPTHLLENYSDRITTSLNRDLLTSLLRDELLPSLLVRQSALAHYEGREILDWVYIDDVPAEDLPRLEEVDALVAQGDKMRPSPGADSPPQPCPWALVVLPLTLEEESIGLWLLGRRDPDDNYVQAEIEILRALANQTSVAFKNILQAEQLCSFYQANIDREEMERSRLARVLHDDVLNGLAHLGMLVNDEGVSESFSEVYHSLTDLVRRVISGVRPAMITYGLGPALEELADEMDRRAGEEVAVLCHLPINDIRFDPRAEQHLYRIVQQACDNALRHAHAGEIQIAGMLAESRVNLVVSDDGIGFRTGARLNLAGLLVERHFGLVGMYERAGLIGARVQVQSQPGQGTQILVEWIPETSN